MTSSSSNTRGGRYHVAHVSTAATVRLVREAKVRNLAVSCEVTPHHFTLIDEAVRGYDSNTKMNPPLRPRSDLEGVLEGLRDGTIEVIATDHAPHSFDEKQVEYPAAPFGIVGLETALGLVLTELFHKHVLSLQQIIEKLSLHPRRFWVCPRSASAKESRRISLFHPSEEWVVDPGKFRSRSRNTPFGGWKLKGRPLGVVNNGTAEWNG